MVDRQIVIQDTRLSEVTNRTVDEIVAVLAQVRVLNSHGAANGRWRIGDEDRVHQSCVDFYEKVGHRTPKRGFVAVLAFVHVLVEEGLAEGHEDIVQVQTDVVLLFRHLRCHYLPIGGATFQTLEILVVPIQRA